MKHFFDFNTSIANTSIANTSIADTTVAFGKFDGVHIGHRAVLKELSSYKNSVVISFADNYGQIIYTETEKEFAFKNMGIENMITIKADTLETMNLSEFVKKCLIEKLGTKTIVAGENYSKLQCLKKICTDNGIVLRIIPTIFEDDNEVTTDLVRQYFSENKTDKALKLLGGSYIIAGSVGHGKEYGRKHGIPTANLIYARNKLWPEYGVYATFAHLGDSTWNGLTNIGLRPSADDIPIPTCETLILDFDGNIYDTVLVLEAFKYVRPIMKFSDLDEVHAQIEKDIRATFKDKFILHNA